MRIELEDWVWGLWVVRSDAILKKVLFDVFCVALVAVCLAAFILKQGDPNSVSIGPISQDVLPGQRGENESASMTANLTAQVAELKRYIVELEAKLAQKEVKNEYLEKEANGLRQALDRLLAELDAMEKIEEIRLVVERLRSEPPLADFLP